MTGEVIKEIKNKIAELNATYMKYHNWEQGTKIMINSFYGGLANPYMYFFDPSLAECITKQGKNAILYAESYINEYFQQHWVDDTCTHRKMGIKVFKPVIGQATVYIDTDSVYSQLDEVISTTDWKIGEGETNWGVSLTKEDGTHYETRFCGSRAEDEVKSFFEEEFPNCRDLQMFRVKAEAKDFALRLDEVFLAGYFKHIFELYAEKINADNYLNFELETYSDAGIWLAKKKYIQNLRWNDSMPRHDILTKYSKIKSKGVELIQPSSPTFARKKLTYLVRWIFERDSFKLKDFVGELKKIKDELMVANPDDISWNKKATEYLKWVISDNKELEMLKGTPITTKGIAYYNYKLNNNPKYKNRYSPLTPGTKCKYYYCKDKECEMFAYEPGMFPIEFAPEIDRKLMFEKTILTPINRIVEAIGYSPIKPDLIVLKTTKLF